MFILDNTRMTCYILITVVNHTQQKAVKNMKNNIARLRKEAGMTQDELAAKAGISRPYLSTVETGGASPTITVAGKIATALGATVDEVFE